ncbi:MAG: zinc carboxypeptidase [Proteobacteria bacterium]|nr:zinc carboxypeptidase [Pseudomonadota bacterium]
MSKAFRIFLLLSLSFITLKGFAHTQVQSRSTHIIEVDAENKDQRSRLANLGYALEEFTSEKVYLYGNNADLKKVRAAGFNAKAFPLQERWLKLEEEATSRFTSYPQALQRLRNLEAQNPTLATLYSIGKSSEGRDIVALRISNHTPSEAETLKIPTMIYLGCHHAREHLSLEVPLLFAEYLLQNYTSNQALKDLMDQREIYIVPVVNPDGHTYDYTDGVRGKMWRKNRNSVGGNKVGVDLNRNYGYQWGTGGSSTEPDSEVYMGPSPFSEPETQAVRNFFKMQTRLKATLDFHSFSELILYPWGYTNDRVGEKDGKAEDRTVFEKMAQDMSQWNHYTPEPASDLYIASGVLFDWAYGELGLYSFTFELSPTSMWDGGFYPSPSVIPQVFADNLRPMLYMLEFADNPKRALIDAVPNFIKESPAQNGIPMASHRDLRL